MSKKVSAKSHLRKVSEYASKNNYEYDKTKTLLYQINQSPVMIKQKIKKLIKSGRNVIKTKEELKKFPLGTLVSYITKEGLYRSGGFLRSIKNKYFALQGGNVANPISFPVQFSNIKKMYVGSPIKNVNRTVKKTNFPVMIGKTIVYYAKSNYDIKRFKATKKYFRMASYAKSKRILDLKKKIIDIH